MEIRVKILLNKKDENIEILKDGRYQVSVNADRKQGEANLRMQKLIAKHFGVDEGDVSIVSGHTISTKVVRIRR